MSTRTYTYIDLEDGTGEFAKQCNDCGAHVITKSRQDHAPIEHYPGCNPGEAEREAQRHQEMEDWVINNGNITSIPTKY